jgi:hypothetical protein
VVLVVVVIVQFALSHVGIRAVSPLRARTDDELGVVDALAPGAKSENRGRAAERWGTTGVGAADDAAEGEGYPRAGGRNGESGSPSDTMLRSASTKLPSSSN